MIYLAGDIGGTKALLQLIQISPNRVAQNSEFFKPDQVIGEQRFLCCEFDSLESIISTFLSSLKNIDLQNNQIESACFGLPGPVSGRVVELTNLPWVVNADLIEQACNIKQVLFVNDFYAAALGVEALTSEEKLPLYQPENTSIEKIQKPSNNPSFIGNRLVVGAGTGLGVAPIFYDGNNYLPQSSEGGHFDFAPISETQQILLNWLWQKWQHVSYERVLSGPGLETLYEFFLLHDLPNTYSQTSSQKLHKNKLFNQPSKELGLPFAYESFRDGAKSPIKTLSAPDIHKLSESGDIVAIKAITELVTIYGAFVGAAALLWNAPGGIYLAGGIALKIKNWMQSDFFVNAFLEKGRMSKVTKKMPIFLVTNESLGLRGAMQAARNMTE